MDPVLSVIIPTRNRVDTAILCAKHILSYPDPDIELIVHDCSTNKELSDKITELSDPRLRYFHVEDCAMTTNWNLAIEKVRGEYVTIIGDDDGISAEMIKASRWASKNGVEAINSPKPAAFFWPGFQKPKWAGKMMILPFKGDSRFLDLDKPTKKLRFLPFTMGW